MPMLHTTQEELARFGALWDAWDEADKPPRLWFVWWCVGATTVPDESKIAAYKESLHIQ